MKKTLIAIILITLTSCNYSEGKRTGVVVKFSHKGIFFKTWEGELATLAKGASGTMINNTFEFTVDNPEIIEKIQEKMNTGSQVTLTYNQSFFTFPWEGQTTYFITSVN